MAKKQIPDIPQGEYRPGMGEDIHEIKELGEEKYKYIVNNKLFKFGDIIENGWASLDNPRRFGIIVKARPFSIQCTDGVDFWDLLFDSQSKIKHHGNTLNENYAEIKSSYNKQRGVS